jgi:G:T-mismatch repair DNA endonuclease (very short patch repair protein)
MSDILDGYCGCGCGELTNIFRGKPRKFIAGHQARGMNNSRFGIVMDDELKRKISNVRKEQGSPWWEGREHTDESKKKMSDIRKVIFLGEGNPFYGKHHSEETKQLIRDGNSKYRSLAPILPTKPEKAIHGELIKLGVQFSSEHLINDKFCVDVFVPDDNLIIYIDGCYWHACPLHFPNNKKPYYDNARVPYLSKCGYNVEIIWEHDIKDRLDEVMKEICLKYNIRGSTPLQAIKIS